MSRFTIAMTRSLRSRAIAAAYPLPLSPHSSAANSTRRTVKSNDLPASTRAISITATAPLALSSAPGASTAESAPLVES